MTQRGSGGCQMNLEAERLSLCFSVELLFPPWEGRSLVYGPNTADPGSYLGFALRDWRIFTKCADFFFFFFVSVPPHLIRSMLVTPSWVIVKIK